jgi:hypothetical protein
MVQIIPVTTIEQYIHPGIACTRENTIQQWLMDIIGWLVAALVGSEQPVSYGITSRFHYYLSFGKMKQSTYFTISCFLSQFLFFPLLRHSPQHEQQHSSGYSGRV